MIVNIRLNIYLINKTSIKNHAKDEIIQWLTENIYRYGAFKHSNEILNVSTQKNFLII